MNLSFYHLILYGIIFLLTLLCTVYQLTDKKGKQKLVRKPFLECVWEVFLCTAMRGKFCSQVLVTVINQKYLNYAS